MQILDHRVGAGSAVPFPFDLHRAIVAAFSFALRAGVPYGAVERENVAAASARFHRFGDRLAGRHRLAGDALAGRLVTLRKEAVDGRKSSGIEDVWLAAEEAYLGIDDVNRTQWGKAQWSKPTSMQATP